jgi:hypothetical protein
VECLPLHPVSPIFHNNLPSSTFFQLLDSNNLSVQPDSVVLEKCLSEAVEILVRFLERRERLVGSTRLRKRIVRVRQKFWENISD